MSMMKHVWNLTAEPLKKKGGQNADRHEQCVWTCWWCVTVGNRFNCFLDMFGWLFDILLCYLVWNVCCVCVRMSFCLLFFFMCFIVFFVFVDDIRRIYGCRVTNYCLKWSDNCVWSCQLNFLDLATKTMFILHNQLITFSVCLNVFVGVFFSHKTE